MLEVMLLLVAGGLLLATAIPAPAGAPPSWLRGVAGLSTLAVGLEVLVWVAAARPGVDVPAFYRRIQAGLIAATVTVVVLHGVMLWAGRAPRARRVVACAGFVLAVLAGSNVLHELMLAAGTAVAVPPKALSVALQTLACAGAAALPGLTFAYALFPLAGVTTPEASAAAFRRLHRAVISAVVVRAIFSIGLTFLLPGLLSTPSSLRDWAPGLAAIRWVLGLALPVVLATLAYERAGRGLVFSASAVLLLAALCAMNGEAIALELTRGTGLPF